MTATLIAKRRDRQRFTGGERGSATLELVIIAPVTILFIVVLILGHRVVLAGQAVEQAAEDAARTASISRNPSTAQSRARASALASLNAQNLRCSSVSVSVDTAGFAVPVGQPAEVSALVTCPVYLADLVGFGLPGSRTSPARRSASWIPTGNAHDQTRPPTRGWDGDAVCGGDRDRVDGRGSLRSPGRTLPASTSKVLADAGQRSGASQTSHRDLPELTIGARALTERPAQTLTSDTQENTGRTKLTGPGQVLSVL